MIINSKSGFYGYTVDTSGNIPGGTGLTNKCIIAITYSRTPNDIDVTVSNGEEDWAIQAGDKRIIPVSNPKVLFTNRDNCLVEFTISEQYPTNVPIFLIYRSSTAVISTQQRLVSKPFEVNSLSGYFAFTVENKEGKFENGLTDTVQATITFPPQKDEVDVVVSADPSHWGVRAGNGEIIPINTPNVLFTNSDSAVVYFKLETPYPTNSPVILVYRSKDAYVTVTPKTDPNIKYIPAKDIRGVPSWIYSNEQFDLFNTVVVPPNASFQFVQWSVKNGPGVVEQNRYLKAKGLGSITLNGKIEDDGRIIIDKDYMVKSVEDTIRITNALPSNLTFTQGQENAVIYITAESLNGLPLTYKWYKIVNTVSTEIPNSNKPSLTIDTSVVGVTEYRCTIQSTNSKIINSNTCTVTVDGVLENISFKNPPAFLTVRDIYKFEINPNGIEKDLIWSLTNLSVGVISNGTIHTVEAGSTDIICIYNGKGYTRQARHTLEILPYKSITDVTNLISTIETDTEVELTYEAQPSESLGNKKVRFEIVNDGGTGAVLSENRLRATGTGTIQMNIIIEKGLTKNQDFVKSFSIKVNEKFIPVTNLEITIPDKIETNKTNFFATTITPLNATSKTLKVDILSDSGTWSIVEIVEGGFNIKGIDPGNIRLKVSVIGGTSITEDFSKNIEFEMVRGFVPVSDITDLLLTLTNLTRDKTTFDLTSTVIPSTATNKEVKFELVSSPVEVGATLVDGNKIRIKENIKWWELNENPQEDLSDQFKKLVTDPIQMRATVINGLGEGKNYSEDFTITYEYPEKPNVHINPKNITFDLNGTNLDRIHAPIPMGEFNIYPSNATKETISLKVNMSNDSENSISEYSIVKLIENETSDVQFLFNYGAKNGTFLSVETLDSNTLNMTLTKSVKEEGNDSLTDFSRSFNVNFRPPYIQSNTEQTKEITIYRNGVNDLNHYGYFYKDYIKNEDLHASIYAKHLCDISTSTYNDFSITDISKLEDSDHIPTSTFDGKLLNINSTDLNKSFSMGITVPNGLMEHVRYKSIPEVQALALDYKVKVNVIEDPNLEIYQQNPNSERHYLVKLTLKNGEFVYVKYMSEMTLISNPEPDTYQISINNKKFAKKDVISIDFWDDSLQMTKPKSLKYFACNFTSLTSISAIPSVSGNECLMYFLKGCTSFNQPIVIPNSVNGNRALFGFLEGCTSFNSDIVFQMTELSGDWVLGKFLAGCTSFNKDLNLPSSKVLGKFFPMYGLLMNCTSFNGNLSFPRSVGGLRSLEMVLFRCTSFNKDITLPNIDGGYFGQFFRFMVDNWSYTSNITIPDVLSKDALSNLTFSVYSRNKESINSGFTVSGDGADKLLELIGNNTTGNFPLRNIRKQ